ncbi:glycosyltransferase family 2 protein [Negadavirga shengliensis]|uniref:Glycosyltransferase family 2 protein n=1 Tax=Negadavirga shengliensis TaxID=1389218 RepID=A0ABV9T4Q8_9BACT
MIIPCFNQGSYLQDCLKSILLQDFPNWQAIVVNDGSTDNTAEVGTSFSKEDSRIQTISQGNLGLSEARNTGMRYALGDFLIFLDADDWLEPHCLRTYSNYAQSSSGQVLYRCGYSYSDQPDGRKFHSHIPTGNGEIYPKVLEQNLGPCHSLLISKEFSTLIGGFDPSLKSCEDWDFWIRAGKMGASIESIPEVLVAYRYISSSMSRNPLVMYESLTAVSIKGAGFDSRLPKEAVYNQEYPLDTSSVQKHHLIRVLGILLHKGSVDEAVHWYMQEKGTWKWNIKTKDWNGLSSYLTWRYFLDKEDCMFIKKNTLSTVRLFLEELNYSPREVRAILRSVFAPQLKKMNHYRYGPLFGRIVNRIVY